MNLLSYKKHNSMCFSKIAYESERKAKKAAKQKSVQYRDNLRFYECPICNLWHLTKLPQKDNAQERVSMCPTTNKIRYDTEAAALHAKSDNSRFLCNSCNKWHTTTMVKHSEQWYNK